MDLIDALRFFAHVARLRSISAAARAQGLSTTAASKKLQDLEARLGTRLVDRTTRSLSLTEAGERLLARSSVVLDDLDQALAAVRDLHSHPVGRLRILCRRSFGVHQIAPLLPAFRTAYPEIALDLELTEDVDIAPGNGIDLVVRLGEPGDKTLAACRLTSGERKLCASPEYVRRAGLPKAPADLAAHDCLTYRRAAEPATWIFEDKGQVLPMQVSGPLQANSGEVLLRAALDGLGLVLLPIWMVERDIAEGFVSVERAARDYGYVER